MQFTALTFFGLALAASAYELPAHPAMIARAIEARGTNECLSVASTVLPEVTGYPTPPAAVTEYLETASVTQTDACVDPLITGDVGSQFTSWATAYSSWADAHVSDFRALWQACSDVSEVATVLPTGTEACSSLVARITSNPAPGPRETGAVAAAALFAAGAVAAAM
ncbi:hypothetical protein SLS62_003983 [Diatrype stigma]|uniref:Infection structure specific protein n=1 Tax=Diatrype stigma TaxID=117547 RepID=A0AAN9UVN3_9PEZI